MMVQHASDIPSSLSTIGTISAAFGLTLRTLRFYEERQLLHPVRVGTRRFYTQKDRIRLEIIAVGKRLGLTLHEVGRFFEKQAATEPSAQALASHLGSDVLLELIRRAESRLADVNAALDELRHRECLSTHAGELPAPGIGEPLKLP